MSKSIPMTYKNKTYKSLRKLCNALNLNYNTILYRINTQGMSLKEAIETPIKKKKIKYKTELYESLRDLCKKRNLSYNIIRNRKRHGLSLKEAIETPFKTIPSITYKGKEYKNLKELCRTLNLNYNTILHRMNEQKMPLEKALETPIRKLSKSLPKGFRQSKIAYTHNGIDYYECIHNNQKYILSIQEMKELSEKKEV